MTYMTAATLARDLEFLRSRGFSNSDATQLHHFSLSGRSVSVTVLISYFEDRETLRGPNVDLAARCHYMAEQLRAGRKLGQTLIVEALTKWPLRSKGARSSCSNASPIATIQQTKSGAHAKRASAAQALGDAGETCAYQLLRAGGYEVQKLSKNYPTYDLSVATANGTFYVSVKVSRRQQQIRLGGQRSVERLGDGHFVFAFMPDRSSEVDFAMNNYRLLILPAEEVRREALAIHEAYESARGNGHGFSVMVRANQHGNVWRRWLRYEDAWHLLPACKRSA